MLQPKALAVVNEVRKAILGKGRRGVQGAHGHFGPGPHPAGGQPRRGQDHLGPGLFQSHGPGVQPGTVHPRGDARRRGGLLRVGQGHGEFLLPAGGPCCATCFWPMKSTAPAPRPKAPCWRPWRRARSRWTHQPSPAPALHRHRHPEPGGLGGHPSCCRNPSWTGL